MAKPPSDARVARLLAIGYWISGVVLLSVPIEAVRIGYLTAGNVMVLTILERRRRIALAHRREELVAAGYEQLLLERYGAPDGRHPRRRADRRH